MGGVGSRSGAGKVSDGGGVASHADDELGLAIQFSLVVCPVKDIILQAN